MSERMEIGFEIGTMTVLVSELKELLFDEKQE